MQPWAPSPRRMPCEPQGMAGLIAGSACTDLWVPRNHCRLGVVTHACRPRTSKSRRILRPRAAWATQPDPASTTIVWGSPFIAQWLEHFPGPHKTLVCTPSTTKAGVLRLATLTPGRCSRGVGELTGILSLHLGGKAETKFHREPKFSPNSVAKDVTELVGYMRFCQKFKKGREGGGTKQDRRRMGEEEGRQAAGPQLRGQEHLQHKYS